jgi:hypothetical protein
MPHVECLACKTRLHKAEKPKPIRSGGLCPVCGSLLTPLGNLSEIVRVPRSRDTRRHVGPRGVGRGPADRRPRRRGHRSTRVKHARVQLEIESCDAHSVSPQVQAVSSRAPGTGDEAVRRRRAPTTTAPPRVARVLGAFDDGRHRRERARRKFALRPRPSFGWRAAKWDRPRATTTTTPPSVAPRERHGRRVPGWQATQRRGPV